jgi:hypothetical protein
MSLNFTPFKQFAENNWYSIVFASLDGFNVYANFAALMIYGSKNCNSKGVIVIHAVVDQNNGDINTSLESGATFKLKSELK